MGENRQDIAESDQSKFKLKKSEQLDCKFLYYIDL
jgi:hypothetical protein